MESNHTEELNKEVLDKVKAEIKEKVVWSHNELHPKTSGGQSCGVMPSDITLYSEDLEIKITVGYNRSIFKNKELAMTLFELAMDDLIK
jgi:hypothetical protein